MKKKVLIYSLAATLTIAGVIVLAGWRRRAAIVATSFLNQQEIGNNSGFADAAFQQMLADVGWISGEEWCMYYDKAVWIQAFPQKAAIIRKYLTGSTQRSWAAAIANPKYFKVITSGRPMIGDIIIWQSVNDPSHGHAGIPVKNDSGSYYQTVEGNSGLGGTTAGQGVAEKRRYLVPGYVDGDLKLLGFIRMKL